MSEFEPIFSSPESTAGTGVTTLNHDIDADGSHEVIDESQKVTDEQLQALDPSVLDLMSDANAVLGGEKDVDEAFAETDNTMTPDEETPDSSPVATTTPVVTTTSPTSVVSPSTPATPVPSTPPVTPPTPYEIPPAPVLEPAVPIDDEPLVFGVVDQSRDAEVTAHDVAKERLTAELNEGGRFRRFVKGIWKGNTAKDAYEATYAERARHEIEEAGDIHVHKGGSREAMLATIERLSRMYDDEEVAKTMVHEETGERRVELDSNGEVANRTKDLIRRFVAGELDEAALVEERGQMLRELAESSSTELIGPGKVRIDNIIEIATAVRGRIEHGQSLDRVLDGMKFVSGESRTGVRGEAHYSRVEAIAKKITGTKLGALLSPTAVITAVGIVTTTARFGSHSVVGAALKTVAPGAGGAIWAGLREARRVKEDRSQHMRERAQGGEIEVGSKRREQMETTLYDAVDARQTAGELRRLIGEDIDLSNQEAFEAALASLAAVDARIKMGDQRKIDLIRYSDAKQVEVERLELDLARAEAKIALKRNLTDEMRIHLGINTDKSLNDVLAERSQATVEVIFQDMSAKDVAFNKLRLKRVGQAALIGGLAGLTIGLVAQEGIAALDSTRAGLVEQIWHTKTNLVGGEQHQTLLAGIVNGDHEVIHHVAASGFGPEQHFGTNGTMSTSPDYNIHFDATNNEMSIVDPTSSEAVSNIPVGPDGSLSSSSIHALEAKGFHITDLSHNVTDTQTSSVTQSTGVEDFVHQHSDLTTHVKRDFWFDNNTSGVYDRNELGLHWGGDGVNDDGSFQMSVSTMTGDGSFHDGASAAWAEEARNGTLKLAVSATSGTQSEVFMVPIGADGSINIEAGSPAADFFANENGQAVFNGQYAEVVQIKSVDDIGITHMRPLATLVGQHSVDTIQETIQVTTESSHTEFAYQILAPGYDTIQQNFTEMAPNIPVASRRSLENLSRREMSYYYQGGEVLYGEEALVRRGETSPRLLENPDADLRPGQELKWHHDLLVKKRGRRYVKELEDVIESTPELRDISSDIKAIVQIPVNAAGNAETNGIYRLLTDVYGRQDPTALNQTLFLLHVNWFDEYPTDGSRSPEELQANIEKTRAEITRAMADNPQLRIAVINTEWHRIEVRSGVIGHVARKMYDVSLLALNRAAQKGQRSDDDEAILIRNDADAKGISVNYLRSYVNEVSDADILTGTTSFDSTKASRLPGMVFAAGFMQGVDLLSTVHGRRVHTGGANFGVRASTFAAVGGLGTTKESYNGAGADDVNIGRRIKSARDGVIATDRGRHNRRRGYAYAGVYQQSSPSSRRIAKRIAGRIETDSDREEELYVRGIPIINTWNSEFGFDREGYRSRDEGLGEGSMSESVLYDSDAVIERIRNDMEGTINGMGASRSIIDTSLIWAFPRIGTDAYRLTIDAHGFHLQFTDAGIKYLKNHLARDSRGRFDNYGTRKMRQLYGRSKAGAKRQPTHQELFEV